MCGLAVTVSFEGKPADQRTLTRMADVLRHRGPDDSGIATYGPIGFAFRRLAILDLSPAGHQPMESADGKLSIVFNGEIYNYLELKHELQGRGHVFRTTTDTEVLLAAYRQWGSDCVSRFNGMWAFVIYDRAAERLFASRDRFGVKPLYRYQTSAGLILASEIKAIVASDLYSADTNWQTASKFLVRGRLDDDTQTFFKGIDQLPAGSTLDVSLSGRCAQRQFWSLQEPPAEFTAPGGAPDRRFHDLLRDAVRLRMRSDVPVGVCLSGGIDSNAIISFMAALRPKDASGLLQAFSYIPKEFSEERYITESIQRTGAELNELRIDPARLWEVLPTALWHYDEPVHSATALIGFELMRLARSRGVKVVLNGQGADEVNGGYYPYFQHHWAGLIREGRWARVWSEISWYAAAHNGDRMALARSSVAHTVRMALESVPGYLAMAGRRRAAHLRVDSWFTADLMGDLPLADVAARSDDLAGILRYSVERRPLPLYLRVEDRNSMAHSVEARLPFLDYRLVAFSFSLPNEWKLRGPWNKFVVREAMRNVIAEGIRSRLDKMGFPTPAKQWFSGPWYEPTRDLLGSRAVREGGVINVRQVERDLERHRMGDVDVAGKLFRVVEFGLWLSRGEPSAAVVSAQRPMEATT